MAVANKIKYWPRSRGIAYTLEELWVHFASPSSSESAALTASGTGKFLRRRVRPPPLLTQRCFYNKCSSIPRHSPVWPDILVWLAMFCWCVRFMAFQREDFSKLTTVLCSGTLQLSTARFKVHVMVSSHFICAASSHGDVRLQIIYEVCCRLHSPCPVTPPSPPRLLYVLVYRHVAV